MRRFLALCGFALLHFFALSSAIFFHRDALAMHGATSPSAICSEVLARVLLFPVIGTLLRSGFALSGDATFYLAVALNSFAWALAIRWFLRRRRKTRREYSQPTVPRVTPVTQPVEPMKSAEPIRVDETSPR